MKNEIEFGRVVGETIAFVDVEIDGHDVRNILAMHADKCFNKLTPDERAKIADIIFAFMRGDIAGTRAIGRIKKNCIAIANSKPSAPQK